MSKPHFIRSAWMVSVLTLISRILGLIRDKALVLVFGGSAGILDAFLLAFTIPNLFRRLFGEGALSGAFIPVFVKTRENESEGEANRLASSVTTLLTLILTAIALIGMVLCFGSGRLLGPESTHALALLLTAAMLPFMVLICISALMSGMLQSVRHFGLPAAMPVLLNLTFLAALGWIHLKGTTLPKETAIFYLAGAVVLAGAPQLIFQFPLLRLKGVALRPSTEYQLPGLRTILMAMGPTILGLAVFQINVLIDRLIAYLLVPGDGALTHLYLGNRLMQLPLALFGISIATTSFPDLVSHLSRKEWKDCFTKLATAFRFLCFVMLPATAGLIVLADPIIRMIFQEPDLEFSDGSVYRTSLVLILYAPGLIFIGLQQIMTRIFYGVGDYRTPVRITTTMVALNIFLNLIFIHLPDPYLQYLSSAPGMARLGEGGLALATSVSAFITVLLMWSELKRRLRTKESEAAWDSAFAPLSKSISTIAVAALVTGVVTWLIARSIPYGPELIYRLERGLLSVILGVLVYWMTCATIPVPELEEFLGSRRKKKTKTP
ncbi:MAG: murein biosynthesis integral membrane protein MurJ [Planctomycetota bacterium]|jgi:putative peptidoglycan lipid II flippase